MKTKDLIYIGAISFLAFLLLKDDKKGTPTSKTNSTGGGANSGGLNLGSNMDLPNLTPTPANGLPTEVALNNSNVSPLPPDKNEPTQIFGGIKPPPPFTAVSVVKENPIDVVPVYVVPVNSTVPTPIDTVIPNPQSIIVENPLDTAPTYGYGNPRYGYETPTDTIPRTNILINPRRRFSETDYLANDYTANASLRDSFTTPYAQLEPNRY
jgi:hypothetical protein